MIGVKERRVEREKKVIIRTLETENLASLFYYP